MPQVKRNLGILILCLGLPVTSFANTTQSSASKSKRVLALSKKLWRNMNSVVRVQFEAFSASDHTLATWPLGPSGLSLSSQVLTVADYGHDVLILPSKKQDALVARYRLKF